MVNRALATSSSVGKLCDWLTILLLSGAVMDFDVWYVDLIN